MGDVYGRPTGQDVRTWRPLAVCGALVSALVATAGPVAGQTVTRVSAGPGGVQSNGLSAMPVTSADGRYVTFVSGATNLVAGDTNGRFDAFVADRTTNVVTRVSVATDGTEANGNTGASGISADGRYIVFLSFASNLVAGDTNNVEDVFVRDRDTDADGVFDEPGAVKTVRVSVKSDGSQATSPTLSGAFNPSISPNGRYVIFESGSADLVAGDTNGRRDVFVHDRDTDGDGTFDEPGAIATTRVSVATGGAQGTGGSASLLLGPFYISDSGEACFTSGHTNLVAGDTNGAQDVFCRYPTTGTTVRVSVTADGAQTTLGFGRGMSASGRYVLFESTGTNHRARRYQRRR